DGGGRCTADRDRASHARCAVHISLSTRLRACCGRQVPGPRGPTAVPTIRMTESDSVGHGMFAIPTTRPEHHVPVTYPVLFPPAPQCLRKLGRTRTGTCTQTDTK